MKILYITTIGGTMDFFKSFIQYLLNDGHQVDIATNETSSIVADCYREWGCGVYPLSCSRSPLNKGNLAAIREIKALVREQGYDIVHCHTPIAAACTRLACAKARKQGTKVIYTAHGFHFYDGAPRKNWLIFYPIEKLCAHFTDLLVTINGQDYALAQKKLRAKKVCYIPGVGIDVEKFASVQIDRKEKREELGIPEDAFLMLSVGELNQNKNQQIVLRAMARRNDPRDYYIVAGVGDTKEQLLKLATELGIAERVRLLGYRTDVAELYKTADVFVHPSFREGLPVSIMEARAAGLPVVGANIRGNADLINEAFLFAPDDSEGLAEVLAKVGERAETARACGEGVLSLEQMSKDYINEQLMMLYHQV